MNNNTLTGAHHTIRKDAFLGSYHRDRFYRRQSLSRAWQALTGQSKSSKGIKGISSHVFSTLSEKEMTSPNVTSKNFIFKGF